jgi:hypothetical protein
MDYLLITETRSGTHFLSFILEKHPQLLWKWQNNYVNMLSKYYNEIKNACLAGRNITDLLSNISDVETKKIIFKNLQLFKLVQKNTYFFMYLALNQLYKNCCVEKKMGMSTHFQTALEFNLIDICYKINKNIKIILLTRKNVLERYVSQLIRQERENEIGYTNELNFEPSFKVVNCNINDFKSFKNDSFNNINKVKSLIFNKKIEFIEIEFLDLINKTPKILKEIKQFLNLSSEFEIKTPFLKLEKRPLHKIIKNWNAFSNDLKKENLNEYCCDNISL